MKVETIWERSASVLFGQMYEDAEIEMSAFQPGSRVFTIASAGDSALALSACHEVTAVDINPAQLAYARERAMGAPARRGAAENFMHLGRRFMALAGWKQSRLEQFVQMSDCRQQLAFWRDRLDQPLFRALFGLSVASALFALRLMAPRRAFPPATRLPRWLRERLQRGFARYPNCHNPYAKRLIAGHFTPTAIKAVQPIRFVHSPPPKIRSRQARRLFAAVRHAAAPDAVVVLRSFREWANNGMSEMAARDRSMLWGSVYTGPVEDFPECFTS